MLTVPKQAIETLNVTHKKGVGTIGYYYREALDCPWLSNKQ